MTDKIAQDPRLEFYSQNYLLPGDSPSVPFWEPTLVYQNWPYNDIQDYTFLDLYVWDTLLSIAGIGDPNPSGFRPTNSYCMFATHFESIKHDLNEIDGIYYSNTTVKYLEKDFTLLNVQEAHTFINNYAPIESNDSAEDASFITRKGFREACRNCLIYARFGYNGTANFLGTESNKYYIPVGQIYFDYVDSENHHVCEFRSYTKKVYQYVDDNEEWDHFYNFMEMFVYKVEDGVKTIVKGDTFLLKAGKFIASDTERLFISGVDVILSVQYTGNNTGNNEIEITANFLPIKKYALNESLSVPGMFADDNTHDEFYEMLTDAEHPEDIIASIIHQQGSPYAYGYGDLSPFPDRYSAFFIHSLVCRSSPVYGTKVGFGKKAGYGKLNCNRFAIGRTYYLEDSNGNYILPDIKSNYGPHVNIKKFYSDFDHGKGDFYSKGTIKDLNCNSNFYSPDARRVTTIGPGSEGEILNNHRLSITDYSYYAIDYAGLRSWEYFNFSNPLIPVTGNYPLIPFTDCEEMKVTFSGVSNPIDWGWNQRSPLSNEWLNLGSPSWPVVTMHEGSDSQPCTNCDYFNNTEFILKKVTERDVPVAYEDGVVRRRQVRIHWEIDLSDSDVFNNVKWHTVFRSSTGLERDIGTVSYRLVKMILTPNETLNIDEQKSNPGWALRIFVEPIWENMPDYENGDERGYIQSSDPFVPDIPLFYAGFNQNYASFIYNGMYPDPPSGWNMLELWNNSYIHSRAMLDINLPFDTHYEHEYYNTEWKGKLGNISMLGNVQRKSTDAVAPNFLGNWYDSWQPQYAVRHPITNNIFPRLPSLNPNTNYELYQIGSGYGIPSLTICTPCDFEGCEITIEPKNESEKNENRTTVNWDDLLNDELPDNILTNPRGANSDRTDRPIY